MVLYEIGARGRPRLAFTDANGAKWCAGSGVVVPAAVRGIALARRRRPGGDEPMEAGPRRSGDGGFGTPAELGAVAPEAVQEHGELAGNRNLGLLEAAALGDAKAPPA